MGRGRRVWAWGGRAWGLLGPGLSVHLPLPSGPGRTWGGGVRVARVELEEEIEVELGLLRSRHVGPRGGRVGGLAGPGRGRSREVPSPAPCRSAQRRRHLRPNVIPPPVSGFYINKPLSGSSGQRLRPAPHVPRLAPPLPPAVDRPGRSRRWNPTPQHPDTGAHGHWDRLLLLIITDTGYSDTMGTVTGPHGHGYAWETGTYRLWDTRTRRCTDTGTRDIQSLGHTDTWIHGHRDSRTHRETHGHTNTGYKDKGTITQGQKDMGRPGHRYSDGEQRDLGRGTWDTPWHTVWPQGLSSPPILRTRTGARASRAALPSFPTCGLTHRPALDSPFSQFAPTSYPGRWAVTRTGPPLPSRP